eukprot:5848133-Heterocapsa_arctica.AAC.1
MNQSQLAMRIRRIEGLKKVAISFRRMKGDAPTVTKKEAVDMADWAVHIAGKVLEEEGGAQSQ